jgi:capsid protein
MPNIRGGVEIDEDGAPIAYHIREAHIGDWWSGAKTDMAAYTARNLLGTSACRP